MKTLTAILLAVLAADVSAQSWTGPVRITSGSENNIHPAVTDGNGWLSSAEKEMLAFSRDGKDIGILQSTLLGASWPDSILWITTDSADNDYPSLIRPRTHFPWEETMLVWQGKRNNNLEILFSKRDQNGWSSPQAVTANSVDDEYPQVACLDTTYYAVWEQQGKVLFSQYAQNTWTVPLVISGANDTLNHMPQVTTLHVNNPPSDLPCVVWQRRKEALQSFALVASVRTGTVWSSPDTLITDEDNTRPRFYKYGRKEALTWERCVGSFCNTYACTLSVVNGKARLGPRVTLNGVQDTSLNCSVSGASNNFPSRPLDFYYTGAAWESPRQDSIRVSLFGGNARLSAPGAVINRNPTISEGTAWISIGWQLYTWVVWEALVNGTWQLYGARSFVFIADAEEPPGLPERFGLSQNYPNPFNPTTEVRFVIGDVGFVSLKVFDVLGREVSTLVNEMKQPGRYQVVWNAAGVASGVYFYKLESSGRVEMKRMLVMK